MKEINFNTLRDLPVPEKWIKNALAIPETKEQKAVVVPFWRKPRFIAMAASLVLVSALSLALFLSMGSKTHVAVKSGSKDAATEIIWSTDENGATVAAEIVVVPKDDDRQNSTDPTEAKSGIARFFERLFGTESNIPTTNDSTTARGRRNPTTKPDPTESGKPAVKPTENREPDPVVPPIPTELSYPPATEEPTESPYEEPTAEPWVPDDPSEPSWEDPTTSPWAMESSIYVFLTTDEVPQDGLVYCKFISRCSGKIYGDYGDFDDERLMTWVRKTDQYSYYYYDCRAHFQVPFTFEADDCIYYVYDSEGNILRTGYCTLGSYY